MVIKTGRAPYSERWGARIAEQRELRRWTRPQLASELDVSRQAVKAWETGVYPPSDRHRIRLARLFNMEPNALFDLRLDDEVAA